MSSRIARHVRSHVIGYLALFVALGGTAYALGANTVKSKHIVNGQVKAVDLAEDAVSNSLTIASSGADVSSGDGGQVDPVPIPLTNASFSSEADEAVGYAMEIEVQIPSACTDDYNRNNVRVDVYDDDRLIGSAQVDWTAQTANLTVVERPDTSFALHSAPTEHTLSAETYDGCMDGSDFTVKGVKVMAIGAR